MPRLFFLLLVLVFFFSGCSDADVNVDGTKTNKFPVVMNVNAPEEPRPEREKKVNETYANPFLTKEEEIIYSGRVKGQVISNPGLSAIFYSAGKKKVVINGKIFQIGDLVDNKEIVEINPKEVILEDAKGKYILKSKDVYRN